MVEHTLDFIEETRRTKPEGSWCCKCKCLWCANSRSHYQNIYSSKLTERWNRSITKSGQMGSVILMSSFPRIVVFIWTSAFLVTKHDDNERLLSFDVMFNRAISLPLQRLPTTNPKTGKISKFYHFCGIRSNKLDHMKMLLWVFNPQTKNQKIWEENFTRTGLS